MNNKGDWHFVAKGPSSKKPLTENEKKKLANSSNQASVKIKVSYAANEGELLSDIKNSEIYLLTLDLITNFLKQTAIKEEKLNLFVRSVGVGPITTSANAYIQTCFIYLIQEEIKKIIEEQNINIKYIDSYINDPLFSEDDVEYLKTHQMTWVKSDEELMKGNDKEISLFFMPHCEKELYTKVCSYNESNLRNICIIGNSLRLYLEKADLIGKSQNPENIELRKYVGENYHEVELPLYKQRYEAFNNTCFIYFV